MYWNFFAKLTPVPSKLENVVDPGSGPRGPLPGSTTFSNFDGPGVMIKFPLMSIWDIDQVWSDMFSLNCSAG